METLKITENYTNVLRHRVQKSKTPSISQLKKLALVIPRVELKEYVKKAKDSYDSLLNINSTVTKKLMK